MSEMTYQEEYEKFWKEIVENPDGSLNKDQVMRELSDFSTMIQQVAKVYYHVTGGKISKPDTMASAVICVADEYYQSLENLDDDDNDWINVEDELPPEFRTVLAFTSLGYYSTADYSSNKWNLDRQYIGDAEVTHWMSLAEPPISNETN